MQQDLRHGLLGIAIAVVATGGLAGVWLALSSRQPPESTITTRPIREARDGSAAS